MPFNNSLGVEVSNTSGNDRNAAVALYRFPQSLIASSTQTISANTTWTHSYDTSGLPSGNYFYTVRENGLLVAYKFLVK